MTEEEIRPAHTTQPAAAPTGPARLSQPFIRERLPEAAQRNAYRLAVIVMGEAKDNPRGAAIPLHSQNVEEMVTVLEGAGECEIDGQVRPVKARYSRRGLGEQ